MSSRPEHSYDDEPARGGMFSSLFGNINNFFHDIVTVVTSDDPYESDYDENDSLEDEYAPQQRAVLERRRHAVQRTRVGVPRNRVVVRHRRRPVQIRSTPHFADDDSSSSVEMSHFSERKMHTYRLPALSFEAMFSSPGGPGNHAFPTRFVGYRIVFTFTSLANEKVAIERYLCPATGLAMDVAQSSIASHQLADLHRGTPLIAQMPPCELAIRIAALFAGSSTDDNENRMPDPRHRAFVLPRGRTSPPPAPVSSGEYGAVHKRQGHSEARSEERWVNGTDEESTSNGKNKTPRTVPQHLRVFQEKLKSPFKESDEMSEDTRDFVSVDMGPSRDRSNSLSSSDDESLRWETFMTPSGSENEYSDDSSDSDGLNIHNERADTTRKKLAYAARERDRRARRRTRGVQHFFKAIGYSKERKLLKIAALHSKSDLASIRLFYTKTFIEAQWCIISPLLWKLSVGPKLDEHYVQNYQAYV